MSQALKEMKSKESTQSIRIADVRFVHAPPGLAETGLVGFVSFDLNDLVRIDGVALRRTLRGRVALAFPARRDRTGRRQKPVRPLTPELGREIERQVLRELGFDEP